MPIIYYRNPNTGAVTTNDVPQGDLSYWMSQGWTTTPPASSSTPPPSTPPPTSTPTPTPPPSTPPPTQTTGTKRLVYVWDGTKHNIYKVDTNGTVERVTDPSQIATAIAQGFTDPGNPGQGQSSQNLPPGLTTGQPGTTPGTTTGTTPPGQVDEDGNPIQPPPTVGVFLTNKPVFVQFSGDPNGPSEGDQSTIWLYFPDKKQYVPFTSMEAFLKHTGGASVEQIKATQPPIFFNLDPGMVSLAQWGGGVAVNQLFLPPDQGYQANGLLPDGTTGLEQVKDNYGKAVNQEAYKNSAFALDGLLTILKDTGAIGQDTIEQILAEPATLKKYAKGLAFGGYVLSDVLREIKRLELVNGGNTSLARATFISATLPKIQFERNPVYQQIFAHPLLAQLPSIEGLDMSALDLPIMNMPKEIFEILVPPLPDPSTDEFRGMMEQIEAAFYDVVEMQINAQTETQKRLAEVEWTRFREEIERQYGIKLSNSALEAWNQLQSISSTYGERNLTGSGFEAESIDNYLRGVRRADQQTRISQETDEQTKMREYYQKYASSEEIRDLVQRDITTATQWGLVPSQNVLNQFSLETLRSKYPNTPDYLLQRYAESMIDQYGNYRSQLYQNSYASKTKNLEDKEAYQGSKVLADQAEKEAEAFKPYEMSGEEDVFLGGYETPITVSTPPALPTTTPVPTTPPQPPQTPQPSPGYETPITVPIPPPLPQPSGQGYITLPSGQRISLQDPSQDPSIEDYKSSYPELFE